MAFFQNSVLNKHLNGQDAETVKAAYQKFTAYFHNPAIQQNIRDAKEEQFQEGFLRELFVDILGYTLNPQPNFNLTTELKNEKGAKKADGAILSREHAPLSTPKALAVIELKGTDTKDLDKINVQAFNYKNNQTGCVYVITSNFEKLRFFIHHSVEHLEFNLFTLTETEFQLLWLCLRADNLLSGVPLKVKEESLLEEEKITKHLYKDYAAFRYDLWQNMVKNSRAKDKLLLFKKTQKLLDRYLFIFFAEDSGLLPPNSISRIVTRWEVLKQEDAYKPLYDIFKQYFGYIDTGRKGQKTIDDIFAYNGGLFQPDEVLDNIVLDDEMLHPNVMKLTKYDFQSEVDVNILGHIFENSLNEIENITAELEGQEIDKSKTKRKKDGVFYTPKYITKYIVDNTVGKLCEEKKAELGIIDEEYAKGRRNRKKETIKSLDENLQTYRNWLLNITICDPACGSGAFLNQALEFLMEEHAYIDELESQLLGNAFEFPGVENHILEKNIYGVDINEESVDIAKLSLWLRTAQRGRKLTTLNNNIKCGNSLIDDPSVAGEKAFNWQKEFPTVFDPSTSSGGGFDVVIGNPPYLVIKGGRWVGGFQYTNNAIEYLKDNFITASQQINTYILFLELGIKLTKLEGYISQITPNTFLANEYSQKLREYLLENSKIMELFNSGVVFDDASVETAIITYRNTVEKDYKTNIKLSLFDKGFSLNLLETKKLTEDAKFLVNLDEVTLPLLQKLNKCEKVSSYAKVWRGLTTGNDKKYLSQVKENEKYKSLITGSEVERYNLLPNEKFVNYIAEELDRPRDERIFLLKNKLISKFVGSRLTFCFDDKQHYVINTACSTEIIDSRIHPLFLLSQLNSNLINFYFQKIFSDTRSTFPIMKSGNIEALPFLFRTDELQKPFIEKVNQIMVKTTDFQSTQNQYTNLLQSKFEIEKLTTKLQNWHELEFKDFLKELKKAKVQLSLSEEAEWMQYFNEQKQKAQALKAEIDKADREIDRMVYELYGLSEEEIAIVENSTK